MVGPVRGKKGKKTPFFYQQKILPKPYEPLKNNFFLCVSSLKHKLLCACHVADGCGTSQLHEEPK